jgi:hypothetical protein
MIYFESLTREVINILARFLIETLKNAKWMKFNVFSTFSLKNTIFFTAFLGWKEFSINFATAIDPWCNWQHV